MGSAGGVVARAEPGVPVQARAVANRAGSPVSAKMAAAPVTVSPPIVVNQPGFLQHRAHPGPGIGELGADIPLVAQYQVGAFQRAGTVRGNPGRPARRTRSG